MLSPYRLFRVAHAPECAREDHLVCTTNSKAPYAYKSVFALLGIPARRVAALFYDTVSMFPFLSGCFILFAQLFVLFDWCVLVLAHLKAAGTCNLMMQTKKVSELKYLELGQQFSWLY